MRRVKEAGSKVDIDVFNEMSNIQIAAAMHLQISGSGGYHGKRIQRDIF